MSWPPWLLVALGLAGALRFRREPAPSRLSRDPAAFVLIAALGVLLGTLLSHDFRITSDGVDHYVYLRSLWVDHDLDLANDYALVSPRGGAAGKATPLGRTGNPHPVGPAVAWAPFYLVADLYCRAAGCAGDGLARPYQDAVSVASLLYGWLGLVLLYRIALQYTGRGPALLAALGTGFGTFLYWYLAWAPTMAHAPAFGAAALAVWLWLRPQPPGVGRAAGLGAACGLAALMRWANGLLVLLPAIEALPRLRRREEWGKLAREAGAFGLAAALAFSPQMIVWWRLYGSPLTIPQGEGFVAGSPELAGVLFSPRHGLFSWSPLLYLGALGLVAWLVREPWRAAAAVVFGLALARVNAGVADWWGGSAFGGRRFDAWLPLLGLGLALALAEAARLARRRPLFPGALLLGVFVAWNLLLARQYGSGAWDYAGPVTFEQMGHAVVSRVDRAVGSPFSLPASLADWLGTGRRPADWESLYMQRRHARWSVRMGLDERIFLEDGWSEPREIDGAVCRLVRDSAGLVVPLHGPRPYLLGVRLRQVGAAGPGRLRVLVNDRPAGALEAPAEWSDASLAVAAETLRPGRNFLRFRRTGEEAGAIAVAGVWMEPAP